MRDIKGYEGLYSVTEDGRVFGHKRKHYLAARPDKDGYLRVNLYKQGQMKTRYIHRLVAEAYVPNPDNLPICDHIDRNILHNTPDNLRWVSHSGNMRNTGRARKVLCENTQEVFDSIADAADTV